MRVMGIVDPRDPGLKPPPNKKEFLAAPEERSGTYMQIATA